MSEGRDFLVLGIGSDHGDDCIGWKVVDNLIAETIAGTRCLKVRVPIDIVDLLGDTQEVHLVDAAAMENASHVHCLRYCVKADRQAIESLPTIGTHDFGVSQALQLARSLGRPTDHVTIWLAKGESFTAFADASETAKRSVAESTARIAQELRWKRNLAR